MPAEIASTEAVVSLRGLGKVYTPTPLWMRSLIRSTIKTEIVALHGVDLELAPSQICAVVGPNGAGKSTMFRILAGLTTPTSGAARVLGLDVVHQSNAVRRLIGWMPADDRSLFMRQTCKENLHFHGRLQGISRRRIRRRIAEVLEEVGIAHMAESTVFGLSSGMRARLQLARAIMHKPQLLILDEPTGTVDPVGAHALLELITGLVNDRGMAALISSHRLEEIEALGSRVVLLDKGKVRYQGDLDSIRDQIDRPCVLLEFRGAESAGEANRRLVGLADVTTASPTMLRCVLGTDIGIGDVLTKLDGLAPELTRVTEHQLPLRDVLARIYLSAQGAGEEQR